MIRMCLSIYPVYKPIENKGHCGDLYHFLSHSSTLYKKLKLELETMKCLPKMNIFVLHSNPNKAARWHADKHVIKMLLESVQMLYTAHWTVAFPLLLAQRSPQALSKVQKTLPTPPSIRFGQAPRQLKNPEQQGFRPVHVQHPCTKWVRESKENYLWLCRLALALAKECKHRWPTTPPHSCQAHAEWLLTHPPALPWGPRTAFAVAMPPEVKRHDPIVSYRAFYKGSKTDRGITKHYTNRHPPHWLLT